MEPLSPNDPATVGEFMLRARLGAGGMGRVYLASSPAGRAVAIKVVHPELASDPEFRQRFGREVAAARAVSGMYTAPVVASGLDDDPPWLATAYVPGPPLAEVVSGHGPLPAAAVWRLAAGLAEALRAVHACGLVHRDLKPANVLLAADGPHVIDFGISRAFEGTMLTSAGMVIGTPGYMSPEQAEGAMAGPESDVFSLGCVLAYAAAGTAPFGTGSAAAVLYRVVSAEPDLTGVPGQLRQIIEYCLRKSPTERIGLTQLSAMISALGPTTPVVLGSFWPDPVARIIAASQAYPDVPASQASPASAGQGPVWPARGAAQAGYQPTATSLGGTKPPAPGQSAQPALGPRVAGQPAMLADGYLSAATSGMPAGQPGTYPLPGTQSPLPRAAGHPSASSPGSAAVGQPSWQAPATGRPRTGAASAPAAAQPAAPQSATASRRQPGAAHGGHYQATWHQPGTPWQASGPAPAVQQPGTPTTWPASQAPNPLTQYAPGRRRPTRAEVPPTVLAAIRLMYVGAAVSMLHVIVGAVAAIRDQRYWAKHPVSLAGRAAHAAAGDLLVTVVIGGSIGVMCWILLAMACRRGRRWPQIVGTALLGLDTLRLFAAHSGDAAVGVTSVLIWFIGLITVLLVWGRKSREFFAAWHDR